MKIFSRPFGPQSPPHGADTHRPSPKPPRSQPPSLLISRPLLGSQAGDPAAVNANRRSWRESIVQSPYPLGYQGQREKAATKGGDGAEAILTLVLYDHRTRVPRVSKVVVPVTGATGAENPNFDEQPTNTPTLRNGFDDEMLFKLVRAEYSRMRGLFGKLIGARNVRDLGFLSYTKGSQLVKQDKGARRRTFPVDGNDGFAETELLAFYRKPKLGRGEHGWVDRIERLEKNSGGDDPREKVALELVEGWCIWKIALALLLVVVASLAAALLWTFLGVGYLNCHCRLRKSQDGFRGAGGRVETGAVLGTLVLLLGWTGVGAWILLSWLV